MVVFLRNKNLPFFQGHYHQFFVFMGKYFGPRCLSVYGKGLFRWSLFCRAPGTILVPGGGSESTLFFKILYVLVIINHGTRKIEHFAVTTNPNVFWLVQQMRNATPYDQKPKYLVHDNDAVFTSGVFKKFLAASGIKSKRTSIKAPWQNPYAERVIGTLRRELLDHIIPVNERHLGYLLGEYIHKYYNTHRTHQGIGGRTPIPSPKYSPTTMAETKLKATPVLGGLYHTYKKVA